MVDGLRRCNQTNSVENVIDDPWNSFLAAPWRPEEAETVSRTPALDRKPRVAMPSVEHEFDPKILLFRRG